MKKAFIVSVFFVMFLAAVFVPIYEAKAIVMVKNYTRYSGNFVDSYSANNANFAPSEPSVANTSDKKEVSSPTLWTRFVNLFR